MRKNKRYLKEVDKLCSKQNLSIGEIEQLARICYADVTPKLFNKAERRFYSIMEETANFWSEYDPKYPNDPYEYGYELEGHIFIIGYSGVVGNYWNEGDEIFITKP